MKREKYYEQNGFSIGEVRKRRKLVQKTTNIIVERHQEVQLQEQYNRIQDSTYNKVYKEITTIGLPRYLEEETRNQKSGAIADAAYESGWENLRSLKLRRGLALVIQRANRKVTLTAGGFADLSFETLVALTTRDLVEPIVVLLRFAGCDPKHKGPLIFHLFCYYFILSNAFWTVFIILKLIAGKDSLAVASNTYINYIITTQIPYKAYALHAHSDKLLALLDVFWDKFWDSQTIKGQTNKYNKWHKMILRSIKIYRGILCVCIVFIFASPLLLPVRTLPLELWFFGLEQELHKSPIFEILYAVQCFSTALPYVFCLIPFDMLFIVMVGCANIQFDMLRHKFMMIVEEEKMEEEPDEERENKAYEKLEAAVVHHNLCLTFLRDLQNYFTGNLLKQYLDAVSCMGVYIYLEQQDFHFVYLFSLMTNMSQTLLYSLCGQIIQDQSAAVADAAFESGWENLRSLKLRQGLALVIQRSHRKVKITAGGFIDLSFESFVGMLKAAFSFLAVLRSTNRTQ